MRRFLETLFAHRVLPVVLILLSVGVAVGIVVVLPPTYQASARIWFDTTSIGSAVPPSSDQSGSSSGTTPAQVAVGTFTELLSTQNFCVRVAGRGPLESYVSQHTSFAVGISDATRQQELQTAIQTAVEQGTKVSSDGANVVNLSYNFSDPDVAAQTLSGVLQEFSTEVNALQLDSAKRLVTYYSQQVQTLQTQVTTANEAVNQYLNAHPQLKAPQPPPDATLTGLQQVAQAAQQNLDATQQNLQNVSAQVTSLSQPGSAQTVFRTLDAPTAPVHRAGLVRSLLLAGGAGLAIGLVFSLVALGILTAADGSAHSPDELEGALGLKVVGSVPFLSGLPRRHRRRQWPPKPSPDAG